MQIGSRTAVIIIIVILVACLGLACTAVFFYSGDISDAGEKSVAPITNPGHPYIRSQLTPVPEFSPTVVPGILMGVVGAVAYMKGRDET